MSWTDERVELLKKLWMEGLSASQIAAELSDGVTRNAVIGKVHRLKLSARAKPSSAPRPRTNNNTVRPAPRRVASPSGGGSSHAHTSSVAGIIKRSVMRTQVVGATALAVTEEMEVEAYVAPAAELFIPEAERVTLLGLNEHTCKWPIGDPLAPDFYFCGRDSEEGHPYCQFHSRRAYHQVDKRKR
ncbi:MAG TPA: GcrA family cell cycle regulator [Devosiaceae bacterium]|jgi:GcrA cell cycle regulator